MDRRLFLVGALALSACQTTSFAPEQLATTSEFDGRYELYVGRLGRDTAFYRQTGNAGREEELARLILRADAGVLSIVSVNDHTNSGPNYEDFFGAFYEDGNLRLQFTTSFLFNQRSTYTMSLKAPVSAELVSGRWIKFEPEGWDHNNDAILQLRKIA